MEGTIFRVSLILILSGLIGASEDEGFLPGTTCHEAQDCYINGGTELALACYYSVNKCKCYSTISSIYHLNWDKATQQCLMSKYRNILLQIHDALICVSYGYIF